MKQVFMTRRWRSEMWWPLGGCWLHGWWFIETLVGDYADAIKPQRYRRTK